LLTKSLSFASVTSPRHLFTRTLYSLSQKNMKAVRVHQTGGPEVLKIEDVPIPKPEKGQVLVKVHAAGVNPVDTYIRSGRAGYALPRVPWTPGSDCAGTVEAVGDGVTQFHVGDRVCSAGGTLTGSYAQYTLCTTNNLLLLPSHVSFDQGAALWVPYGTAYHALFHRAKVRPSERVLIHGASGGVGQAALQLARAYGCTVLGTAGTERGLKFIAEQGAHHTFNHKEKNYEEQILNATNNQGVDVIVEMLANVNLDKDLKMIAVDGRIAIVGSRGTIEIEPRDTMARRSSILGVSLPRATDSEKDDIRRALYAGLESRVLRPVIGQVFPLAQVAKAHEEVIQHSEGSYGKIVLHLWE
jgi:NADPH2:quinone reductase